MRPLLLLVSISLIVPLSSMAQRDPNTENTCYARLNHDNVRACIKEQAASADKELVSAEKLLAATLKQERHNAAAQHLTQANARYRQYRKAQCAFQADAASGKKSAPDREMLCTTALDLQRAKDLKTTTEMLRGSEK
ncbi:hypothetical protein SDC9_134812 [bioreactor metagenome]|uniref:Lysozyme inhibitor LprI-like N-terminal domain-containing protein n=1 Tax=bioreactor metagenome TaxID=1076179 RepID=A0A645DGL4_9ZZZZ